MRSAIRIGIVVVALALVSVGAAVVMRAQRGEDSNAVAFVELRDLPSKRAALGGRALRIHGTLAPQTLVRSDGGYRFVLEDDKVTLDVEYTGALPAAAREGMELMVEGKLASGDGHDVFEATRVLVKL